MSKWLRVRPRRLRDCASRARCVSLCVQTARQEQAIGDAATALKAQIQAVPNLQPTLDAISGPRGTLHEVNKAVVKIGDMAVTSQRQVAQSSKLVDAAAQSITSATSDVHTLATEGTRTLAAATQLTQGLSVSLPATVDTANSLLSHSDAAVTDFNALLKDEAIHRTLANLDATTQNLGGITLDARLVSDKISADYLKPKTPWSRIGHVGLDLLDIGAMTARHVP